MTYDISLRLRVSSNFNGIPRPTIDGEVLFGNTLSNVDISLGIDSISGLPYAQGARINNISPGTVSTQFTGLDSQFLGTVASEAQGALLPRLGPLVLNGATGLFEGLVAGMDLTMLPPGGFPVGRLDGTGNVTVALGTRSGIGLLNNGLTLVTGLRVTDPPSPPDPTGRFPLPPLDDPTLTPRPSDVWSAAHIGVFNQVLQTLWRVGLFDGTLDGAALGSDLPTGTSLSVQLRTMPVVTEFDLGRTIGLDVGTLNLVVTHPGLPSGLRVAAGARIRAGAALLADDLVFDHIGVDELRFSTGALALDPTSRATLQDLIEKLLVKLADVALNGSLPALPATVVTFPPSLGAYGLPVGNRLVGTPSLVMETNHVFLEGPIAP